MYAGDQSLETPFTVRCAARAVAVLDLLVEADVDSPATDPLLFGAFASSGWLRPAYTVEQVVRLAEWAREQRDALRDARTELNVLRMATTMPRD